MKIKNKGIHAQMIFLLVLCTGALAFIVAEGVSGQLIIPLIILACAMYLPILLAWMARGKTIEMNRHGCTVSFLWYRKFYRWDELKTKRIVDYSRIASWKFGPNNVRYDAGVEFSPRIISRKQRSLPFSYAMWKSPLKYFFVNFRNQAAETALSVVMHDYEVDAELFFSKMKEWGVVLGEAQR